MDAGELISDDLAYKMLNLETLLTKKEGDKKNYPCEFGIVFDGFPRTVSHAIYLKKLLSENNMKIDHVFAFNIEEEILIKRVLGRLIHVPSGRIYHEIFNPPKNKMKDDITGE